MTASRSLHSLMLVLCATVAASSPAFISAPGLMNCTCAAGSLGYECRMPASNACFSKNGGVCPGGTEQLPDCCAHCAGDHPQRGVCQDSLNLACYPAAADGTCPPGTQKCPPASKPTPAPSAPPCTAKPTLCVQPSYCGQSSDPDAEEPEASSQLAMAAMRPPGVCCPSAMVEPGRGHPWPRLQPCCRTAGNAACGSMAHGAQAGQKPQKAVVLLASVIHAAALSNRHLQRKERKGMRSDGTG